jgi:hypothetical protein
MLFLSRRPLHSLIPVKVCLYPLMSRQRQFHSSNLGYDWCYFFFNYRYNGLKADVSFVTPRHDILWFQCVIDTPLWERVCIYSVDWNINNYIPEKVRVGLNQSPRNTNSKWNLSLYLNVHLEIIFHSLYLWMYMQLLWLLCVRNVVIFNTHIANTVWIKMQHLQALGR